MSQFEIGSARAISAIDARSLQGQRAATGTAAGTPARAESQSVAVDVQAIDTASAPVDTDRVSEIRRAIEQGTYPVLPQKIGDAMIAAGMLLRTAR